MFDKKKYNTEQLKYLNKGMPNKHFGNIEDLDPMLYDAIQMEQISRGRGRDKYNGNIDDLDPKKYDGSQMSNISRKRKYNSTVIEIENVEEIFSRYEIEQITGNLEEEEYEFVLKTINKDLSLLNKELNEKYVENYNSEEVTDEISKIVTIVASNFTNIRSKDEELERFVVFLENYIKVLPTLKKSEVKYKDLNKEVMEAELENLRHYINSTFKEKSELLQKNYSSDPRDISSGKIKEFFSFSGIMSFNLEIKNRNRFDFILKKK